MLHKILALVITSPISSEIGFFFVTHILVLVSRTRSSSTRSSFDKVGNTMKVDRFVDDRRVKQRYRGGIQIPDQMCSEDAPQLSRGFVCQLEHVKPAGPARSLWGVSLPAPTRVSQKAPFSPKPGLVDPRVNINSQQFGERRANEICIDESEVREQKQLEGV